MTIDELMDYLRSAKQSLGGHAEVTVFDSGEDNETDPCMFNIIDAVQRETSVTLIIEPMES